MNKYRETLNRMKLETEIENKILYGQQLKRNLFTYLALLDDFSDVQIKEQSSFSDDGKNVLRKVEVEITLPDLQVI